MSYVAWTNDYNRDSSVIGSTFWMNTKPVTIVGIAPQGFLWRTVSPLAPPDFYMPMKQIATIESADYVDDPDRMWLYVIGRVKPVVDRAAAASEAQWAAAPASLLPAKTSRRFMDKPLLEKAPRRPHRTAEVASKSCSWLYLQN